MLLIVVITCDVLKVLKLHSRTARTISKTFTHAHPVGIKCKMHSRSYDLLDIITYVVAVSLHIEINCDHFIKCVSNFILQKWTRALKTNRC